MKTIQQIFEQLESDVSQKKTFLLLHGKKYLYKDLVQQSRRLNTFFRQTGLQPGDQVAVALDETWEWVLVLITALRCGMSVSILNPDIKKEKAQNILQVSRPKALFLESRLEAEWALNGLCEHTIPVHRASASKGRLFQKLMRTKSTEAEVNRNTFPEVLETLPESPFQWEPDPEAIALITFTSGTTGHPKGVLLTHRNLFTHLHTLSQVYEIEQDSNLLNILPFYQADGSIQGPLLALFNQCSLFHPFSFDLFKLGLLFASIYKHQISHFLVVPTMLNLMLEYADGYEDSFQTPSFKYVISSAARLHADLWTQFEKKFQVRVLNVYGLSETVAGGLFCGPAPETFKLGSIGKPVDCEVRIVDEAGQEAPPLITGEILLRGDHVFQGYLNHPEATAAALRDGWLYTGDLGYVDPEGFYFLNGRKKNLVISGGINIQPEEVMEVLDQHPAVLESFCLGLEDPIFQEKLVAALVLKPDMTIDSATLAAYCREKLETPKVPHAFFFLETLPRTVSGKVIAQQVKEMLLHYEQPTGGSSSLKEGVFAAAAEAFNVPQSALSPDDTPQTLEGWDSMNHLQFVVQLEQRFQVRLSTAEIMALESLKAAAQIVQKKLNA